MSENYFSTPKKTYSANIVSPGPTRNQDDMVQKIFGIRTDFDPVTIRAILTMASQCLADYLTDGFSYQDENFRYSPVIHGAWDSPTSLFDKNIHKIGATATPTVKLRKTLEEININILGEKHGTSIIGRIIDQSTGAAADHIVPGEYIRIEGKNIRIFPEDEAGLGVFFVSETGTVTPVTHRLTTNTPSKIEAQVPPTLPYGDYTLRLISRYVASGTTTLNEPRIIEYRNPLTASAGSGSGGGNGGGGGGGIG